MRRTTQALTHALIALVVEKRYDAITIQDLLQRADIVRSTFYAHYRSKDDLLLRSFERLLERMDQAIDADAAGAGRLAPVRELFQHVGEFQAFHRRLAQARVLDRLYQAGTDQLSRTIAGRLAARAPGAGGGAVPLPLAARARAGALFALLRWWVDHGAPYTPEQMDAMFHALR